MYRIYIDKKVKNCIVLKDKIFLPLCLYMYDYKIKKIKIKIKKEWSLLLDSIPNYGERIKYRTLPEFP